MAISRITCTGWAYTQPEDTDRGVRFTLSQLQDDGSRQFLPVVVCDQPEGNPLPDNVLDSVNRGDCLIVAGRLQSVETRSNLTSRTETVLLADAIGHDLRYGTAHWHRPPKDER